MTASLAERLARGFECPDKNGKPVLYRHLRDSDDLQAMTELLNEAYAPLAAAGMRFVASFQSVEVTRRRVSGGETIVAVEDAQIIGTITLKSPDATNGSPFYDRPDVASVGQFAVAPTTQHRGIGSALASLAEERATEMRAQYLALDTSERATHLIALYEARGYRQVENVRWPDVNYRSVVMAKLLT